ncbi:MAG: ankyrin repeat domain-containing protein [Verrucomicrobiae bacterium]
MIKPIFAISIVLFAANIWAQTIDSSDDLIEAAKAGTLSKVQSALDNGANVNGTDLKGITALMYAGIKGHWDIVKLLLDKGADVNKKQMRAQLRSYFRQCSPILISSVS